MHIVRAQIYYKLFKNIPQLGSLFFHKMLFTIFVFVDQQCKCQFLKFGAAQSPVVHYAMQLFVIVLSIMFANWLTDRLLKQIFSAKFKILSFILQS